MEVLGTTELHTEKWPSHEILCVFTAIKKKKQTRKRAVSLSVTCYGNGTHNLHGALRSRHFLSCSLVWGRKVFEGRMLLIGQMWKCRFREITGEAPSAGRRQSQDLFPGLPLALSLYLIALPLGLLKTNKIKIAFSIARFSNKYLI